MPNEFQTQGPDYELGARRMQVVLLRDALSRYAQHHEWCKSADGHACNCGLADAFRVGTDAREVCGLPAEERVTVCSQCPDSQERTNSARAHGKDIRYNDCEFHRG